MTSLPRFSVNNPVLVNLAMMAVIIGGVFSYLTLIREMFPESRPDRILIMTPYPGATPAEAVSTRRSRISFLSSRATSKPLISGSMRSSITRP